MNDDEDGEAVLPGQSYNIYNARDVLGSVAEECELVVGRAASRIGVTDGYLNGVVEKYERRIVRWWETEKKQMREALKEESELEEEED